MIIGANLDLEGKTIVLKISKKELLENVAESFAGFAQSYMNDGRWEEAEECLHITNFMNGRKETLNG